MSSSAKIVLILWLINIVNGDVPNIPLQFSTTTTGELLNFSFEEDLILNSVDINVFFYCDAVMYYDYPNLMQRIDCLYINISYIYRYDIGNFNSTQFS